MSDEKRDRAPFAAALGALLGFAALAKGAYDVWAATAVHVFVVLVFLVFLVRRRDAFPLRWAGALALALVALAVSMAASVKPGDTLWALKDCFFAGLVLLMAADVFESESALSLFLLIICVVVTVEAGLMIHARAAVAGPNEAAGSLVNANVAAFFFLPWLPVFYERARSGPRKGLWLAALIAGAIGIFLAFSYSAFILLALALPFVSGARPKSKSFAWAVATALVLIIGLVLMRHYQLTQWTGYRLSSRLDWWRAGWAMFLEHPWAGVGLGNYQSAFLVYKTGLSQNTLFAHNMIVTVLSETGLIGLAGVAAAGVILFRRGVAGRRAFGLGFFLMLAYALYNIGPEYFVGKLMLALFAGVLVGKGTVGRLRVSVVTTVVIAGVLFLPYLVTPFLASQNLVAGNELIESDIEKARSAYRAAAELDPLLAEAHAGLARAAFLQGRVNEAVHHQQDALRLDRLNQKYLRDLDRYQSGAESNVS